MRKRLDRLWLLNVGNFRQGRGTTAGRYFIIAPTRKAARDGFRARFGSMVETVPIACLGQANRLLFPDPAGNVSKKGKGHAGD